jgi:hypothetical protein
MNENPITKERFPENAPGDFYVENQVCIACGAPEAEAPLLIEHSKAEYGHCYFKKQPENEVELEMAICAMQVSCIAGIRYGGNDQSIIQRLFKLGLENECDYAPEIIQKYGLKSLVEFEYYGTFKDLYDNLIAKIIEKKEEQNGSIIKFSSNNKDYFEFIYSPGLHLKGTQFVFNLKNKNQCTIELRKERDTPMFFTMEKGDILNQFLESNKLVQNIIWYNTEGEIFRG